MSWKIKQAKGEGETNTQPPRAKTHSGFPPASLLREKQAGALPACPQAWPPQPALGLPRPLISPFAVWALPACARVFLCQSARRIRRAE